MLSACDNPPSEHLETLTEDKYPVANMPDEPLETPLEINIEPKRLAMTSLWSAGIKMMALQIALIVKTEMQRMFLFKEMKWDKS